MSGYGRSNNKLEGVKGMFAFLFIGVIIALSVYCMYVQQVKHRESKIVTDPIVLTNPGGAETYEIDEETMEDVDEDTGLKSIFDKITGKIVDTESVEDIEEDGTGLKTLFDGLVGNSTDGD